MGLGKSAGRPAKGSWALSKKRILVAALPLIQKEGIEAVSFRRLADCLGVTPMAVKYHVGDRREMLTALVDRAFQNTLGTIEGDHPVERLRYILSCYCARALENANLVRCILHDTSLMSGEIIAITKEIRKNTRLLNDGDPQDVMLNLLVDYTHGFVFSAIATPPEYSLTQDDFQRSVDWVLGLCTPEASRNQTHTTR